MPRRNGGCTICRSEKSVQDAVDAELLTPRENRKTYDELSEISGFSRSSLCRHALQCLRRRILENFRNKNRAKCLPSDSRVVTRWPDGTYTAVINRGTEQITLTAYDLRPTDVVGAITLHKAKIRNPAALGLGMRLVGGEFVPESPEREEKPS